MVLRPSQVDAKRSQMSVILASRARFDPATARDVSADALAAPGCEAVDRADLCVYDVADRGGRPFLLASFHGDSDGRATLPVLAAVHRLARTRFPRHALVMGLDANTAAGGGGGALDVGRFCAALADAGMGSCWRGQVRPPNSLGGCVIVVWLYCCC